MQILFVYSSYHRFDKVICGNVQSGKAYFCFSQHNATFRPIWWLRKVLLIEYVFCRICFILLWRVGEVLAVLPISYI